MKNKKIELDVDFIGGEEPLTIEEEKALSAFFKERKSESSKQVTIDKKRIPAKQKLGKKQTHSKI